ncbi:Endoplasmic reticulum metallopeptidase 1 [Rhizoclosmatium sp. JEL0117]|nr:Endoplasmic reticulum metallopeptidase 1 [Rhizoclosmatium sp. JEL0117]
MELTPVPKSFRPVAITSLERIRLISILAYVVVITILFLIFRGVAPSPTALSFDQAIASNDFPALDAYAQLEQIAIKPHPFNTTENIRIYHYLLDTLNGYKNTSKAEMSVIEFDDTMSFPQIMVYFQGRTNSTVLVSAHFDSRELSPGASDDGAGTTVMLQLVRLFSLETAKSQNSVLFLFNNGEEWHPINTTDRTLFNTELASIAIDGQRIACEGSSRFMLSSTWKSYVQNIKVFLNLEAGGAGGKPIMLRSTTDKLSNLYTTLPFPHMNSFGADFMRILGSGTDYEVYAARGLPGVDMAYYENRRFYHTKDDSLEHISASDVQYMGSNALAIVKQLRSADWIDDLRVESAPSAFYDHFRGVSAVVISSTARWLIFSAVVVGLAGTVYLQHKQVKEHYTNHGFRSSWVHFVYNSSAGILGFLLACVFAVVPFVTTFFAKNYLLVRWTVVPLAFLGCLCSSFVVSGFWHRRHELNSHQSQSHLLFAGLVFGSIVAAIFTGANLPLMYLVGIIAVARLLTVIVARLQFNQLSLIQNEIIKCGLIATIAIYPTTLLLDAAIDIASCVAGTYFLLVVPVMLCFVASIALPALVGIDSMNGRRMLLTGLLALFFIFSLFSLIRSLI